ncbi:matrixin family metalloprotease [archaeon]|nr:matrixin family metalloprotease [archaeon]
MSECNHVKCQTRIQTAQSKIAFSESENLIDEWPHNWPDGEISYRLNSYTDDIKKKSYQDRAVTVALRAWQLRINKLKFRRERNPDAKVNFNVEFEDLAHFDGMKGVLAHAYFPGQGEISGDCHINDEWNWVTSVPHSNIASPPLVPVLIHEFGHSLGLKHDTRDKQSIMYPSFDLGKKKNKLGPNDIQRIQQRYGARSVSQRLIDYFQRRRDMAWDFR